VALAIWGGCVAYRRHRASRYRRLALVELARIEAALADPEHRPGALAALPVLVKRTALASHPRAEIASLSTRSWLEFLDASYGGRGFSEGPGYLLSTLAYASPASVQKITGGELGALIWLVRTWIQRHDVRV